MAWQEKKEGSGEVSAESREGSGALAMLSGNCTLMSPMTMGGGTSLPDRDGLGEGAAGMDRAGWAGCANAAGGAGARGDAGVVGRSVVDLPGEAGETDDAGMPGEGGRPGVAGDAGTGGSVDVVPFSFLLP